MDISWQVLRRIAQDWGGASAELTEVRPLDGGCISTTVAISLTDGRRAVCKVSPHRVDRSYVNEAHQLRMMKELGLPTPRVYAAKVGSLEDPFSYILMEFVEGMNLNDARRACNDEEFDDLQAQLAELLLCLHQRTSPQYGRAEVEPTPLAFSGWPQFVHHVFDPIVADVLKSSLIPVKSRKQIAKAHEHLDRLLSHDDCPRLVHWDVWATNILARPDSMGRWRIAALLDPNCKFAHVESELAYMSLFHTSTPAFIKAYQQQRRLCDEYHRVRKSVYQLYFLLNHVHLFGAEYVKPLMATLERVAPLV